jgi:hypothetical protein
MKHNHFLAALVLCMAAQGISAQITPYGSLRLDFGADLNFSEPERASVWNFDILNPGTYLGLKCGGTEAGGWIIFENGGIFGEAWVALGPAELRIGRTELAWAQWSGLALWGDGNWSFGGSASSDNPFIQAGYHGDALSVYAGIQEAGTSGAFVGTELTGRMPPGAPTYGWVDDDDDPATPPVWQVTAGEPPAYSPCPAFYAAAEYTIEGAASFGGAFAGQYVGGNGKGRGRFPFMVNVHGKLLSLSPVTIGLNAAFYSAPSNAPGLFSIANKYGVLGGKNIIEGDEALVLETMLNLGVRLDSCFIGVTAAFVANVAAESEGGGGMALKAGANAVIPVGETGFSVIPGVIYTNFLRKNAAGTAADGKDSTLGLGITLQYGF